MSNHKNNLNQKIKVTENGPYVVSGDLALSKATIKIDSEGFPEKWEKGQKFDDKEAYSLCRCGHSKSKPYCDNRHLEIGFDGTETATKKPYLDQAERMEGPNLVLNDAYDLCASARFCDRAGSIWSLIKKDDPKSEQTAIQEAADCPSGRLVVYDKKTGKEYEPKMSPEISITEDPEAGVSGPIWVRGGIPVESSDSSVYEVRNRVTLCRCGKSKNKPFCDSTHIEVEFNDGDENLKI